MRAARILNTPPLVNSSFWRSRSRRQNHLWAGPVKNVGEPRWRRSSRCQRERAVHLAFFEFCESADLRSVNRAWLKAWSRPRLEEYGCNRAQMMAGAGPGHGLRTEPEAQPRPGQEDFFSLLVGNSHSQVQAQEVPGSGMGMTDCSLMKRKCWLLPSGHPIVATRPLIKLMAYPNCRKVHPPTNECGAAGIISATASGRSAKRTVQLQVGGPRRRLKCGVT